LHEYQSKMLMEKYNVAVQKGDFAENAKDSGIVARRLKEENPEAELILKAQIHAGGRGKGHFDNGFKGGVQVLTTPEEVEEKAEKMIGAKLITKQTGPEGQLCAKVLVNEGITIHSEYYFAILMDRAFNGPVIVASTEGGMDIEEVAETNPGAIVKTPVDIATGLTQAAAEELAGKLGFEGELVGKAATQFRALYDLFIGTDATQVEINPLAIGSVPGGESNQVIAVDAKLNFDDNAAFRQGDVFDMRDKSMEDPRDVAAEEAGLNYIGLDGNIGCMVNGAGLAMATMDIVKLHGGEPANFLDVGGGATADQVASAFKIITSDSKVEALMVNIFGGIMKCDTIATGIVEAVKQVGLTMPLVVRLEGTNVETGKTILQESGLNIIAADDLDDAAKKAVAAVA
jgi:succinyl-CoA synthetase beta subunit